MLVTSSLNGSNQTKGLAIAWLSDDQSLDLPHQLAPQLRHKVCILSRVLDCVASPLNFFLVQHGCSMSLSATRTWTQRRRHAQRPRQMPKRETGEFLYLPTCYFVHTCTLRPGAVTHVRSNEPPSLGYTFIPLLFFHISVRDEAYDVMQKPARRKPVA